MEQLTFKLEGVVRERDCAQDFEGPLSVILTLLTKNKIEIKDIRIADILEQYLSFIEGMELDLDSASEFVQMASHLVYIKTRTLLAEDEEQVTELDLLISSLEELKSRDEAMRVREVTVELGEAYALGSHMLTKPPEPVKRSREYEYRHEPIELLRAIFSISSRGAGGTGEQSERIMPKPIIYSVHDKSLEIIERLIRDGSSPLNELYARCGSRTELVATFISVLELCGMGTVVLSGADDIKVSLADDAEVGELPAGAAADC